MRELTSYERKKLELLIEQMTLDEKIGQMSLASPSIVGGFDVPLEELIEMMTDGRISKEEFARVMSGAEQDYHEEDIRAGRLGAMILQNPKKANELQKIAVEKSRLGIPLIYGYDVIHGYRTVFPIPLAEACMFDEEMFERTAEIAARESRANAVHWNFAPMLDVSRDARWGRISESPGEDPYLASCYGAAKVRGLQGRKPSSGENTADTGKKEQEEAETKVAVCLKHFVGYSACEAGRDYNTVSMSVSSLYNGYLPPFRRAVGEGAMTVMSAFNDLNGVPCTVNSFTLRKILKEEFGFDGFVVSDANAVRECVAHGIACDERDAGVQAANAGLDMDMGTGIYQKYLKDAVQSGVVDESVIDESVRRILSVKMRLGLFEHPFTSEEQMHRYDIIPDEHLNLALEAAEKSAVLLKNSGVLPLKKFVKISLVGTLADLPEEVAGAWAMNFRREDCVTIRMAMERDGQNVRYFPCGGPEGDWNRREADEALAYGDVIVVVAGELVSMSGEASSRADISLPGMQREMLAYLNTGGKPVVLLLMNGRPLALPWESENMDAILECWHLGIRMGDAVSKILFGDCSPSGKLSCTFPVKTGQCPMYYNHPSTGRPGSGSKFTSRYLDAPVKPLYPFGFGLSYTEFEYSDLEVGQDVDVVSASVKVKNTGERRGCETVQLYQQDVSASLVRPIRELKAFAKVELDPGEVCEVELHIPKDNMGFYDNEGLYRKEDGLFRIYAGGSSEDCLAQEIDVTF